jgi:hypothetical protein
MLSGFVNVFIGTSEDISSKNYKELYSLEMSLNNHKFIPINPSKYNKPFQSEWFILVENPKKTEAAFTLTVDKNNQKSPIEPGITKFVNIGPLQSKDYFYQPSSDESQFEVKLELTEVMEIKFKEQAMSLLKNFVSLYILEGTKNDQEIKLKPKATHIHENIYHLQFSIPKSTNNKFGIRISNTISGSALSFKLELYSGGYKLINMNEPNLGIVKGDGVLVYEVYGNKGKYIFTSVKKCSGNPKLSFYEKDYSNLEIDEPIKYKKIKDENSYIQYAKLSDRRAFIKVENNKAELSVFRLNFFTERDMDTNPYSDIVQDGDGKVEVDPGTQTLRVKPLKIMRSHNETFITKVEYIVYLSSDMNQVRFAKNCDTYMINKVFKENDLKIFRTNITMNHEQVKVNSAKTYSKLDEFLRNGYVTLKTKDLGQNKKLFGVVVARVSLFPADNGRVLSPIRTTDIYYDEFSIITPKIAIPVKLIISCLIIIAFLMSAFDMIKAYLFGDLVQLKNLNEGKLREEDIEGDSFSGPKAFTMLERSYYEEKRRLESERRNMEQKRKASELKKSQKSTANEHCQEVEMEMTDDRTQPLELDI